RRAMRDREVDHSTLAGIERPRPGRPRSIGDEALHDVSVGDNEILAKAPARTERFGRRAGTLERDATDRRGYPLNLRARRRDQHAPAVILAEIALGHLDALFNVAQGRASRYQDDRLEARRL